MTKKHFKELAESVQLLSSYQAMGSTIVFKNDVINMLTRFCKHFNSRFDEDRFRAACEPMIKPIAKPKSAPQAWGDSHTSHNNTTITDDGRLIDHGPGIIVTRINS